MQAKVLLSVSEAASATGMGQRAVREAVERGDIPGKRIGRLIKIPLWWVEEQRSGPRDRAA
jgi:excisionase family DNA binding protein